MKRRGCSMIEAVVFFAIGLLVLGLVATLYTRLNRHDTWNASRLCATESLLLSWEHVQLDLACNGSGPVNVLESGQGLSIERVVSPADPRSETVEYATGPARTLLRSGRPLGGVRLDMAHFGWRDESSSLLTVRLSSSGDRVEAGGIAPVQSAVRADVQITGRARRAEFPSWVDGN